MISSGSIRCFVVTALIAVAPVAVSAHSGYPDHAVKVIVPLPPGPAADTLPRIIAEKLSARWGQAVVIENKPGAAQNLGAELVAKSAPDGYTLLATPQGPLVISQSFFPKLGFDPSAFVPISVFAEQPLLLVANPHVGCEPPRVDCVCKGETRQTQFCIAGHRQFAASDRRNAANGRGHPLHARSL